MKPVTLEFTDSQGSVIKSYSACSLKMGTMDNFFDIAEKAQALEDGKLSMQQMKLFFKDLKAIIVEIFGGQFTYDELNKGIEVSELIKVFQDISRHITSEFTKN